MRGETIFASFLMQGFFNMQESKGDLIRDHYLNSPPIEPSLKEFSHTRKIPRWSGRDSNPRLRAQRQARSPLSHPTTLRTTGICGGGVDRTKRAQEKLKIAKT